MIIYLRKGIVYRFDAIVVEAFNIQFVKPYLILLLITYGMGLEIAQLILRRLTDGTTCSIDSIYCGIFNIGFFQMLDLILPILIYRGHTLPSQEKFIRWIASDVKQTVSNIAPPVSLI